MRAPVISFAIGGERVLSHDYLLQRSGMVGTRRKKTLKILYHHRVASMDGQAVHIQELIAALRARGHEVVVSSPSGAEDQEFGATNPMVNFLRRRLPRVLYEFAEILYSLRSYMHLAREINRHRPDVIYERYNLYVFAGIWCRRRYSLPLLLEVNAPIAEERSAYGGLAFPRLASRAQSYVWRRADRVLPVTQVLAGYVEQAGVPVERIAVIGNGVDMARFTSRRDRDSAKRELGLDKRVVLGFVGFVREWHGLDRILRWMHQSPSGRDVQFVIVGEGPARPALEQQAKDLGISARIHFVGLATRDEIPDWLAAFDIALQPAVVAYASPLKLFEYLAMGCAVVAPNQPNILEVLTDGENARLFEDADEPSLWSALDDLVGDPSLRQRLGDEARRTITARNLTWGANADRVIGLFEDLLAARPVGRSG